MLRTLATEGSCATKATLAKLAPNKVTVSNGTYGTSCYFGYQMLLIASYASYDGLGQQAMLAMAASHKPGPSLTQPCLAKPSACVACMAARIASTAGTAYGKLCLLKACLAATQQR